MHVVITTLPSVFTKIAHVKAISDPLRAPLTAAVIIDAAARTLG
jgi:hypothetical protein